MLSLLSRPRLLSPVSGMGRRHLLYLLYTSSARPPSSPPYFTAPPPPPTLLFRKGYSHEGNGIDGTINHERASSTLDEFKRLEEVIKTSQRVARPTMEKGKDGVVEAGTGDTGIESVSFKEVADVGNSQKPGDSESTKSTPSFYFDV